MTIKMSHWELTRVSKSKVNKQITSFVWQKKCTEKKKERHSILIYENKYAVAGAFFEIKINEKRDVQWIKSNVEKKKLLHTGKL